MMQDESGIGNVRILIEMIDPVGVEQRCAPLYAVNDVALRQQEFGEISSILPGDTGNQSGSG
jgi:hypothetical protein